MTLEAFKHACDKLVTLQSRGDVLAHSLRDRVASLVHMRGFLDRLDLTTSAQALPVVHIAGTKGKGSTSAITEHVLRSHGLRTGLFISPHLVDVRERIQVNGKPLTHAQFVDYFTSVWSKLETTQTAENGFPQYFRFLTCMAMYVFVKENVDVVVLEVGMGGALDATNVIEKPIVTGVTLLDYDHQAVLGYTLSEIARAKAGIFKPGVPAFTVPQAAEADVVLREVAADVHAPLQVITPESMLAKYAPSERFPPLGLNGDFQRSNAALAVTLADTFLRNRRTPLVTESKDTDAASSAIKALDWPTTKQALATVRWPGRAQIVHTSWPDGVKLTVCLDGAHTGASMRCCVQWFQRILAAHPKAKPWLLFNCGHEKNVAELLHPLQYVDFDRVMFAPFNFSRPSKTAPPSAEELVAAAKEYHAPPVEPVDSSMALDTRYLNATEWAVGEHADAIAVAHSAVVSDGSIEWQRSLAHVWTAMHPDSCEPVVCESIAQAISQVHDAVAARGESDPEVLLFVTGSLYLVGNVLEILHWEP